MQSRTGLRQIAAAAVFTVAFNAYLVAVAAPAAASSACEGQMASEIAGQANAERTARGFPAAQVFNATYAQSWAENLRATGGSGHSPVGYANGYGFAAYNENVISIPAGTPSGSATVAFMGSVGHRAWMLSQTTDRIGVGIADDPAHNRVVVVMHMASSTMAAATKPHDPNPPANPVVTNAGQGSTCAAPPPTTAPPTAPPTTSAPVTAPTPTTTVAPTGGSPTSPTPGSGGHSSPNPGAPPTTVRTQPGAEPGGSTSDTSSPELPATGEAVATSTTAEPVGTNPGSSVESSDPTADTSRSNVTVERALPVSSVDRSTSLSPAIALILALVAAVLTAAVAVLIRHRHRHTNL